MSSSPSRLQLLPRDIIDIIIDYLPPPHYIKSVNQYTKSDKNATSPIMQLCPRWCVAYAHKYLSCVDVRYSKKCEGGKLFRIILPNFASAVYRIDPVFRTLTIYVSSWIPFINGQFVNWMRTSPDFTRINFSSVTTLIIDAYTATQPNTYIMGKVSDEVRNIAAFFRRIKTAVPNVKNIKLMLSRCDQWLKGDKFTKMIQRSIAELVYGTNFTFRDGKHEYCLPIINPTAISGLTSLIHDTTTIYPSPQIARWAFEIARHNADTLKFLNLLPFDLQQLERFLFNDGKPIFYHSLAKMHVIIVDKSGMFKNSVDPISSQYSGNHVNHFPALKYLKFAGSYRMVIGHFFGTENRTLEYLYANIFPVLPDPDNLDKPCPVEISTRFYSLKHVYFSTYVRDTTVEDHVTQYKTICSDILRLFSGSDSAFYYISTEFFDSSNTLKFLDANNLWSRLQGLKVRNTVFSFADACKLLMEAPMLQHFTFALDDEPPTFDSVDLTKRPEYLKQRYSLLSASLLKFVVELDNNLNGLKIYNMAMSALLLASMCPRLRKIRVTKNIFKVDEFRDDHFNIDSDMCLTEQAKLLHQKIKDDYRDFDEYDSDFIDDSYY